MFETIRLVEWDTYDKNKAFKVFGNALQIEYTYSDIF